jgi:hypothetical protein
VQVLIQRLTSLEEWLLSDRSGGLEDPDGIRDVLDMEIVGEIISELLALFLPEEMQLLYRQRRCGRHRHFLTRFSWSCSAEPFQLAPVQLECETPRMTTRTRPCLPQDEWRDLKWEFLIGFSAALSQKSTSNSIT